MQRIPASLIFMLVLGLFLSFGASQALADDLVPGYVQYSTYTETAGGGYVTGPLPVCCEVSGLSVNLASDGEAGFDPFGAGYDTSDGIQFTGNYTVTLASSAWAQISPNTFVLPASTACGSENEPTCESTGIFYINTIWSGVPSYISMYEPDGTTLSDLILFDSNGPGGIFEVKMYSDPSLNVPEPGTMTLVGSGFALAGLLRRKLVKTA